ncbi:MAG: asparagine synthase (glutamine-hydrolyzing) [Parcubacteria group bacterium]|nr:asparagine synthase (glutamine-hydrolyzing) [Parcubacteria group bacterium]
MCGIVGVITKKRDVPIDVMTDIMTHRGPDDKGIFTDAFDDYFLSFGQRRLAIIDLSPAGHQPMPNEDKTLWINYNGELYNFLDVKHELISYGHIFRSKSDTEVILKAYEQWGEECVKKFNGMFAIAIWDKKNKKLFCARDHAGQKPFYYTVLLDGGILFASEIKAILKSDLITAEVNSDAIPGYLAFLRVHAPLTMFKNIYKLEPAHYFVWKDGKITQTKWWEPISETSTFYGSFRESCDQFDLLFKNAIKRHMIADVPVGAFLSGGLDSSLIVKLASEYSLYPMKTFTTGLKEKDLIQEKLNKNELYFARQLRDALKNKIDYREILLEPHLMNLLPKIIWHLDEPICDPAEINAYLICAAAREQNVTVVLSGMGGDEVFAGYNHHLASWYISYLDHLGIAGESIISFSQFIALHLPATKLSFLTPYLRYIKRKGKFLYSDKTARSIGLTSWQTDKEISQMLSVDLKNSTAFRYYQESKLRHFNRFPHLDLLSKILYTDFKTFLTEHNLMYTDKMSMASSCEVRSPFLDREIIEFAFSLPPHFKINRFRTKYILKKVAEKYLPREIVWQKKSGFFAPIRSWNKEIDVLAQDILSSSHIKEMGYFDAQYITQLIRDHQENRNDTDYPLWSLLTFALWHRIFIEHKNI